MVCAAIHVGRLPEDRVPAPQDLYALPGFASESPGRAGWIRPMGKDPLGHTVCFLGNRARFEVLERAVRQIGEKMGVSTADVLYVDTMPLANWLMRLGSLGSQTIRLDGLGAAIAARGVRAAYPGLVGLVRRTRAVLRGERPPRR